ncbi:hypothetical protein KIPB_003035 [Kipferlia bialata]|uniref:Uncharacterized protein n=1 Tax=Kipferlia bialata TaxID=797122 RepID=A0A391NQ10_9EUKA|nr:hypothetical protein KIPB_003035 [Kipferlia bialata]|eukprot:g3035.t1
MIDGKPPDLAEVVGASERGGDAVVVEDGEVGDNSIVADMGAPADSAIPGIGEDECVSSATGAEDTGESDNVRTVPLDSRETDTSPDADTVSPDAQETHPLEISSHSFVKGEDTDRGEALEADVVQAADVQEEDTLDIEGDGEDTQPVTCDFSPTHEDTEREVRERDDVEKDTQKQSEKETALLAWREEGTHSDCPLGVECACPASVPYHRLVLKEGTTPSMVQEFTDLLCVYYSVVGVPTFAECDGSLFVIGDVVETKPYYTDVDIRSLMLEVFRKGWEVHGVVDGVAAADMHTSLRGYAILDMFMDGGTETQEREREGGGGRVGERVGS